MIAEAENEGSSSSTGSQSNIDELSFYSTQPMGNFPPKQSIKQETIPE